MWRIALFVLCMWATCNIALGQATLIFLEEHSKSPVLGVEVKYTPDFLAFDPIHIGESDSLGRLPLPKDLPKLGWLIATHPGFSPWKQALDSLSPGLNQVSLQVPSYMAEEVVLSAKRLPDSSQLVNQAIAIIDKAEIQLRQPQTMAEVLAGSGQVFVQKSQMGGGSPNLRGFEANKVLLVVDGIRMNNLIYRSGHLQNAITLDPYLLERSEVLFGPGSVLYGSDALGGVIHFVSRQPQLSSSPGSQFTGNYNFRYGQVNQEKSAHLDLNWGNKRWASLTSLSVSDLGDLEMGAWRPNYPNWGLRDSLVMRLDGQDQIVPNQNPLRQSPSAYTQFHGVQKFLFVPREGKTHLLNLQLSSSSDIPRYDRLAQIQDGRLRFAEWAYGPQTRLLAAYRYQSRSNRKAFDRLKVDLAYQLIKESRIDRQRNSPWRETQQETVHLATLNADWSKSIGAHLSVDYGLEGQLSFVSSVAKAQHIETQKQVSIQTRYPAGGTQFQALAAYALADWKWQPEWSFQAGIRLSQNWLRARLGNPTFLDLPFEDIEQLQGAPSGHLSLSWQPASRWRWVGLLSTGFRSPNLDDMAKVFDSQPGSVIVPHDGLRPEYTYQAEFGVSYQAPKFIKAEIRTFYTYYDQAIVIRPFPAYGVDSLLFEGVRSQVLANVNAKQAWLAGSSLKLQAQRGPWQADAFLNFTYGLVPADSVLLDHLPPLFGQISLLYQKGKWEFWAQFQAQAWKRLSNQREKVPFSDPRDLANQFYATAEGWPAWWALDLKVSYELSASCQLRMGIENLFDLHYRPYSSRISAPGRNLYMAISGNF